MNIFKIKNARFCTFLISLFIIFVTALPFLVLALDFISIDVRVVACFVLIIVDLFLLLKIFKVTFYAELVLKTIAANNKSRTKFDFPNGFNKEKIQSVISKFGKSYEPVTVFPQPEKLQYQFKNPVGANSSGLEMIVATYTVDVLTSDEYRNIIKSININSKNLKGTKKALYLDNQQKKSPLKRTVIPIILANAVEEPFSKILFKVVSDEDKDGFEESILPCILDFGKQTVVFNCSALPDPFSDNYARNRGIRFLKNKLFKRKLEFRKNFNYVDFKVDDIDREQTLWAFLKNVNHEFRILEKKSDKVFKNLKDKQVVFEDDLIYVKFGERGVSLLVELNEESKTATMDSFDMWDYPKVNQIAKETIPQIERLIINFFAKEGYTVKFESLED
ncbi:MAG: hypothetical protein E7557_09290 [Ruminococcaceae bacterium]|nr:hypothetical protein [Oscillospiraceae bacterium]